MRPFAWIAPPVRLNRAEWSALGLTGAAFFVGRFDFALFSLALPDVQADLGVPEAQLSLLTLVARAGALGALVLAVAADRFGRGRLLVLTILGFAVATVATAFAQTPAQFALAQAFSRVFTAADEIICVVLLVEVARPQTRGWLAGALAGCGALGDGAVSLAYGLSEFVPYGWRGLYILGALPALLLLPLRFRMRSDAASGPKVQSGWLTPIRRLMSTYPRRALAICGVFAAFAFPISAALSLMSKHLQDSLGYSRGDVAVLYIGAGAVAIFGNVVAGALADRIGRKPVFAVSVTAMTLGFAGLYLGPAALAPAAWIVALFSFFTANVVTSTLAAELFPASHRATARGVADVAGVLALMAGLAVESFLYPVVGGHGPAVAWLLPVSLLAIPIVLFALPETAAESLSDLSPEIAVDGDFVSAAATTRVSTIDGR